MQSNSLLRSIHSIKCGTAITAPGRNAGLKTLSSFYLQCYLTLRHAIIGEDLLNILNEPLQSVTIS